MEDLDRIGPEQVDICGCDEIVDVRSPGEHAEDHVEGALSLPVLDDEQREVIGRLYRKHPFQARRAGAALIARNAAQHLEDHFAGKPPSYRPLVYCWRGGQRSLSLATILQAVGWRTAILEGGYKAYRAYLLQDFARVIRDTGLQFRIVAGLTGSGKTSLLRWMGERGFQVVDLEGLAGHRGSILGKEPETEQPAQKRFENQLWQALRQMSPERPVYFESESNRIGEVHIPAPLWSRLREAELIEIEAPRGARTRFLVSEYGHFARDPDSLLERIRALRERVGSDRVRDWEERIARGDWEGFVADILEQHYDPAYLRSRARIFREPMLRVPIAEVSETAFARVAEALAGMRGAR
ncbi:MAG TPA: tRNA 2-selenouridine(34) synthase MnmH [Verrucomicrobiales bacterium]|nr:tRNA 2-selenouridine(34) synthase MnmH [Verrucomicrobiales bacterium]